ncbi:MAG TPA: hypothetical protein VG820_06690 [Fimbriimonadaceae bacterium]|nr:hypothetical protein [Fimbriimonadaceae bacterium]
MFKLTSLRFNRKLALTLITAVAALLPLQAFGQIVGMLSNFDAYNNTGQTANDFEVFLGGVIPSSIFHTYTGPLGFPVSTITANPTGTTVHWTGGSVAPGGKAHFGVGFSGNQPSPVTYTWTFNGQPIGGLPSTWQGWNFSSTVRQDVIRNFGTTPVFVQRRWLIVSGPLKLEDLIRGGDIWNAGHLIDSGFVPVPAGGTLTFDFPPNVTAGSWYVLMYDMSGGTSTGLTMTFLNAAQAGPGGQAVNTKDAKAAPVYHLRRH